MKKLRALLFWPLLTAFVAGLIFWSVHLPYRPWRVYSALPLDATFVSGHYNLAGRWNDLRANPVMATFLRSLGVDTHELDELSRDPAFRDWFARLASDEAAFAYVPSLGSSGAPGWVFASWLGGRAPVLRMALGWSKISGIKRAGQREGWPVWVVHSPALRDGKWITFAIVEGMLVGCIGNDTTAILDLLRCADGLGPNVGMRPSLNLAGRSDRGPDRGWLRFGDPVMDPSIAPRLFFDFSDVTAQRLAGSVQLPYAWLAAPTAPAQLEAGSLGALLGDRPVATVLLDRPLALGWMQGPAAPAWVGLMGRALEGEGGDTVALSLLGADAGARLKGFNVPALLAGVQVPEGGARAEKMTSVLDQLNADLRWGLVPAELTVGPYKVYALESTSANAYSSLSLGERIGYAAGPDWLLFGSSTAALTNALRSALARTEASSAPWAGRPRDARIYAWMNLHELGKVLRLAFAAYSFKLLLDDPEASKATRQMMNEVRAWAETIAPLGSLQVWGSPREGSTEFRFIAGE